MELNETYLWKFKALELKELAKDLGLKYYGIATKQELIEQIENLKKQFQKISIKNDD